MSSSIDGGYVLYSILSIVFCALLMHGLKTMNHKLIMPSLIYIPLSSIGNILRFLLHSLLDHQKWITCVFLVKNDSMTHKTINLCDMYYFQPPKLIKNTFKPLFKNLMLPNKTLKFHPFYFKTVYKVQKYVP